MSFSNDLSNMIKIAATIASTQEGGYRRRFLDHLNIIVLSVK
jgi:hypothetical protein